MVLGIKYCIETKLKWMLKTTNKLTMELIKFFFNGIINLSQKNESIEQLL